MSLPPTVLIIEDDPVFRRVLSFTVAKTGLEVETVCDGESGLERLLQGGIDFIVTDFQMPGFGGIELLRRLAAFPDYTRPPAILCTAKGLELDSEQLRKEFDLTDIMHKPFSPRKLSEVIVRHLEERGLMNPADNISDRSIAGQSGSPTPPAPLPTPVLPNPLFAERGCGDG